MNFLVHTVAVSFMVVAGTQAAREYCATLMLCVHIVHVCAITVLQSTFHWGLRLVNSFLTPEQLCLLAIFSCSVLSVARSPEPCCAGSRVQLPVGLQGRWLLTLRGHDVGDINLFKRKGERGRLLQTWLNTRKPISSSF